MNFKLKNHQIKTRNFDFYSEDLFFLFESMEGIEMFFNELHPVKCLLIIIRADKGIERSVNNEHPLKASFAIFLKVEGVSNDIFSKDEHQLKT